MNKDNIELCTTCHKEVSNGIKITYCNSCNKKYHSHCAKNKMVSHRGSMYCHLCLVNKDIAKYKPFYDVLTRNINETEKTYAQNQSCGLILKWIVYPH